ncbi:MAG: FAD-dependent oxidoreductase [Prosthecobacter sp.]
MRCFRPSLYALLCATAWAHAQTTQVDVCIYGATPAGVTAAVAANQEGATVLLVEPSRWVGGILGAGIKPKQDCAKESAVGGLTKTHVFAMGNSPPAIRADFENWLKDENIQILREHRVSKVEKDGAKLTRLQLEFAPPDQFGIPPAKGTPAPDKAIQAKVFIDASYEGDVMSLAGVKYATGREPSSAFNEKPAGVGPATNWKPIDPYVVPGDAKSGLLPLVDADHGKALGEGDDYTQAYNYRFYVTNEAEKRIPFEKPAGYDPAQFELVGRYVDLLVKAHHRDPKKLDQRLSDIFPGWRNAGEYNYQRNSLVTIAPLGVSRFYQDGTWEVRSKVWQQHKDYLSGLHHFLSTDPRVPKDFREKTAALGLNKTMHEDTHGWPNQLYVRITRRMLAPYHLTHADVLNTTEVSDSIGLALYGVDTYPARRYAAKNPETGELGVATEGNMFIGGSNGTGTPYPVPYRAIHPKAEEATNLLVPVCFSATHIAYASARMEPVFCVLGESAGVAAAQAVKAGQTVQQVDVSSLQSKLLQRGQILEWKAGAK